MKLETNIDIGDQSKAAMIAGRIPIPKPFMVFEMSPEKARIFANPQARYRKLIVDSEKIYTEAFSINNRETKYIANGIDAKDGYIPNYTTWIGKEIKLQDVLNSAIISGELKDGDNIDTYLEKIEEQIAENQKLFDERQAEIADFPNHAPQREAAKQAYEAEQEKLRLEKEAKDAAEKAIKDAEAVKVSEEKEKVRLERLAWAQEHGSDRLRKGLEHGHNCIKLYETEIGGYLIQDGDYEYDRENVTETKNRSCPTLAALEEVERIEKIEGLSASVVWLPEGLTELHKDPEEYNEPESGCEAVRIDVKGTAGYWYKTF